MTDAERRRQLEAAGLTWFPGITPLPSRVTGKGVDVANSEHGDRAAICDFADNAVIRLEAFPCPDAGVLGGQVVHEARLHGLEPQRVGVDAIGVGASTVNEARRQGFVVKAIYNGAKPETTAQRLPDGRIYEWGPDVNRFDNFRGQSYWQLREDLQHGRIDLAWDQELSEELTVMTFEDEGKVVRLLPKDEIRTMLGRSPDKSDALVMANWVRKRAVIPPPYEVPQGVSPGFDWKNRREKERESGEELMRRMLNPRGNDPLAGRMDG